MTTNYDTNISNGTHDGTNDNAKDYGKLGNADIDSHLAPNKLRWHLSLSSRITILKIKVQLVT
jgi:hypothetical protein